MKKRILALSLAAAMVIGALASCTKTVEPVSSEAVEARDVKLVLWGSENSVAFLKEVSAEWAKKYAEENADVKSAEVDVQIKGEDVAGDDAMNDIEAAADIFGIANNQLATLSAGNAIYVMPDNIVSDIKAVVGDAATDTTLCGGKYYGFPYEPNTAEILFYDKSVFEEEEVKDLNKMLEKDLGGVTNLAAGITSSWNSMTWFATAGAKLFTGGDKSVNTLNAPEATEMLKWLKEQIDAKKVINIATDKTDDVVGYFTDKKIGAAMFGAWGAKQIKDALGDNFGVAELPTINGKHAVCFGGSKLLVINAMTKEANAAVSLCEYIISEESQLKRFKEVEGSVPTAPGLATNPEVAADPTVAASVAQGNYVVNNDPMNTTANYWSLESAVMSDLYNGKLEADGIQAALDQMVTDINTTIGA